MFIIHPNQSFFYSDEPLGYFQARLPVRFLQELDAILLAKREDYVFVAKRASPCK